jgi:hypothetical protein
MDMGEDAAKDAFYLMLFTCLKEVPTSDKVVILGASMQSWAVLNRNKAVLLANSTYTRVLLSHLTMVPTCLTWHL